MTKETINLGQNANDGSGDTLRTAGEKINTNFDELYAFKQDSALTDAPSDGVPYARQDGAWVDFTPEVTDAPADGTPYARQDSDWISIPSNLESPQDGNTYGRFNGGWARVTEEAPADGTLYGRQDSAWIAVDFGGLVTEAPSNGNSYVRQDSAWVSLGVVAGIPEAPADGQVYSRQDSAWIDITSNLSASIPEAPTDGQFYGRINAAWGPVVPEAPLGVTPYFRLNGAWADATPDVLEAPVDSAPYVRFNGSWLEYYSDADSDDTAYARKNSTWVNVPEEAPADSSAYVRLNAAWMTLDSATTTNAVPEAPADGAVYGRFDSAWVAVTEEAPNDGLTYGRNGKLWIEVPEEAPNDGQLYVRVDKGWAAYTPEVEEAPQDNEPYARLNSDWVNITTLLSLGSDSSGTINAVEEAPQDSVPYVRFNGTWVDGNTYLSGGGTGGIDSSQVIALTDPLYLDSSEVIALIDSDYVQARQLSGGGGIDSSQVIALIDSDYVQARQTEIHPSFVTASGGIATGDTIALRNDGTVEVITETTTSTTLGTSASFSANESFQMSAAYDSVNNRVVVVYQDVGSLNQGTAVVGQVSGTSITFGTPVVFNSSPTYDTATTFDASTGKIVIAYRDGGSADQGTAIVGTVDPGTNSISFGTPAVFDTADTRKISAVYDSVNQKTIIAFPKDAAGTELGTAIVATVSGTSISFGAQATFNNAATREIKIGFDPNAGKCVILYQDVGSLNYGTAIVGTVSGTSITFGAESVFTSSLALDMGMAYISSQQTLVISYRDNGNLDHGTAKVGTISGTDITFGAAQVFYSGATQETSVSYDPIADKILISYMADDQFDRGDAVVGTVSGNSITFEPSIRFSSAVTIWIASVYDASAGNIAVFFNSGGSSGNYNVVDIGETTTNANNFIGFSQQSATFGGQSVKVATAYSFDNNQTGLTINANYWVASDGTLSSSDTGYPKAGRAISGTKIQIGA